MRQKAGRIISVRRMHTSPSYVKESINRLNHISDLMGIEKVNVAIIRFNRKRKTHSFVI
jgi:hypothetical protein